MINRLIKLANTLDSMSLGREADALDYLIKKYAEADDKPSVNTRQVAEWIVGGTPVIGDDADLSINDLTELLSEEQHAATAKAILDYFTSMNEQYVEKGSPPDYREEKAQMDPEASWDPYKDLDVPEIQPVSERKIDLLES